MATIATKATTITKGRKQPAPTKKAAPARPATVDTKARVSKKVEEPVPEEKVAVPVDVPVVEPAAPKKKRSHNTSPTAAETTGLNISVTKVRNLLSNSCINEQAARVVQDLRKRRDALNPVAEGEEKIKNENKVFSLDGLSAESLEFLDACEEILVEERRIKHAAAKVKNMPKGKKEKYLEDKQDEMKNFAASSKSEHLFRRSEFNTTEFNLKYDAKFYDGMAQSNWKSLANAELYDYCSNLINKVKVRFSAEANVYIAAFVERILTQLVTKSIIECVDSQKRTIQLAHAFASSNDSMTLRPLIENLPTYKRALEWLTQPNVPEEAADTTEPVEAPEEDSEDDEPKHIQFIQCVNETCRTVKNELSRGVENSPYVGINVSKNFKEFCSNLIKDLLQVFGSMLKVEVETRGVKTVNYTVIGTLFQISHIIHGVAEEYENTVLFIQERYNKYSLSKAEKAEKKKQSA